MKNWAMDVYFNPIPILQGLFLGGVPTPTHPHSALHRLRPPAIIGLKKEFFFGLIPKVKSTGLKVHRYINKKYLRK